MNRQNAMRLQSQDINISLSKVYVLFIAQEGGFDRSINDQTIYMNLAMFRRLDVSVLDNNQRMYKDE